jgi:hypothetical protein
MTSNKNKSDIPQGDSKSSSTQSALTQYGLSIAIGVILITITVAAFYFGLFPNY